MGGTDVAFTQVVGGGTFSSDYETGSQLNLDPTKLGFDLAGQTPQGWDVGFTGAFSDDATLTFAFDPTLLGAGFDLSLLRVQHYYDGSWHLEPAEIDATNDTVTVDVTQFSPFVLAVPEPGSASALAAGGFLALRRRRRNGWAGQ